MHILFFIASLGLCGIPGMGFLITGAAGAVTYLVYEQTKSGGIGGQTADFFVQSKVERLWKEMGINEPMLKVFGVKGVPVLVGAATCAANLESAKAIAVMQYGQVETLADSTIKSGWNHELAKKISRVLVFDGKISSRNYEIVAIKNRVWIVGVAQSAEEKQYVFEKIQAFEGVGSVVGYIKVAPDTPDSGSVTRVDE